MKPRKLQPIKVGFDDDKIAFYPRMAFQAERDAVERQIAEISLDAPDAYQRIFEIKRDAIAEFSCETPKRLEKVKGESVLVPLVEDVQNTQDAMKKFFAERTVENEEVINRTYTVFLNLMSAGVDFL